MSDSEENPPWVTQFDGLTSEYIHQRLCNKPKAIARSDFSDDAIFLDELGANIQNLFVPSVSTTKMAAAFLTMGHMHARRSYTDTHAFLKRSYEIVDSDDIMKYWPRCFSGIAGVGKSSLLKRLKKVLPKIAPICVDHGHSSIQLQPIWYLSVEEHTTITEMLRSLITLAGGKPSGRTVSDLVKQCRRLAYRVGVCLLIIDEMQSMTRSAQANSRITNVLTTLRNIGVPIVYGANYSLVRRLKRRPHEDSERLLDAPSVLTTDASASEDWRNTVDGYINLAPETFKLDSDVDSSVVHAMTAGSKRLLGRLFLQAAAEEVPRKRQVTLESLRAIYESTSYSVDRETVEQLNLHHATGTAVRSDLCCPFVLPKSAEAEQKEDATETRMAEMLASMLESSMTVGERELLKTIKQRMEAMDDPKVVPIGAKVSPTREDFEQGRQILDKLL